MVVMLFLYVASFYCLLGAFAYPIFYDRRSGGGIGVAWGQLIRDLCRFADAGVTGQLGLACGVERRGRRKRIWDLQ